MKKNASPMRLLCALVLAATVAACTGNTKTSETTGQYIDSSAITAKVKEAIIADKTLHATEIGVETFKDTVQLSGFVDSTDTKTHAADVAASVPGVKTVRNNLIVK